MEAFRSQLQRINETVTHADLVGVFFLFTKECWQRWIRERILFYYISVRKDASTQPRSLSPTSRIVCFMPCCLSPTLFMQIRKGSAARLAFHRRASLLVTKTLRFLIRVGKGKENRNSKWSAKARLKLMIVEISDVSHIYVGLSEMM